MNYIDKTIAWYLYCLQVYFQLVVLAFSESKPLLFLNTLRKDVTTYDERKPDLRRQAPKYQPPLAPLRSKQRGTPSFDTTLFVVEERIKAWYAYPPVVLACLTFYFGVYTQMFGVYMVVFQNVFVGWCFALLTTPAVIYGFLLYAGMPSLLQVYFSERWSGTHLRDLALPFTLHLPWERALTVHEIADSKAPRRYVDGEPESSGARKFWNKVYRQACTPMPYILSPVFQGERPHEDDRVASNLLDGPLSTRIFRDWQRIDILVIRYPLQSFGSSLLVHASCVELWVGCFHISYWIHLVGKTTSAHRWTELMKPVFRPNYKTLQTDANKYTARVKSLKKSLFTSLLDEGIWFWKSVGARSAEREAHLPSIRWSFIFLLAFLFESAHGRVTFWIGSRLVLDVLLYGTYVFVLEGLKWKLLFPQGRNDEMSGLSRRRINLNLPSMRFTIPFNRFLLVVSFCSVFFLL